MNKAKTILIPKGAQVWGDNEKCYHLTTPETNEVVKESDAAFLYKKAGEYFLVYKDSCTVIN